MLILFGGVANAVVTSAKSKIQLPINCILAGNQHYTIGGRTFDVVPHRTSERTAAGSSRLTQLGGSGSPSFTVKTGHRGYD